MLLYTAAFRNCDQFLFPLVGVSLVLKSSCGALISANAIVDLFLRFSGDKLLHQLGQNTQL